MCKNCRFVVIVCVCIVCTGMHAVTHECGSQKTTCRNPVE